MTDILLVLPVPFRRLDGEIYLESQAANGLDRWADNFDQVVVACPVMPEAEVAKRSSWNWVSAQTLAHKERIRLVELPWARSIGAFLANYGTTSRLLAEHIRHCDHLQFAIGGIVGDWGSVAALQAARMQRRYSVWTDRVEAEVVRITSARKPPIRKYLSLLHAWLMQHYERHIIRQAELGLFHGAETYHAYSAYPRHAFLTHDIHTKAADQIPDALLAEKIRLSLDPGVPLKIGYAGRANVMKAPLDWLDALARLDDIGVTYEAAWLGDGELLEEMRRFIERHGMAGRVKLLGFVSDRQEVLAFLRSCHVLLFTHITPESPRIILEALISAMPVVGYQSSYVAEIVAAEESWMLCPIGDTTALAGIVATLAGEREKLAAAIRAAAHAGKHFNDEAVFRHRSELIKHYL
ncbi:MAG: glycosyltransferase [Pseudomonadota bacterium]|nr:glycosyltransferase [Pseudomonadota bacterium]